MEETLLCIWVHMMYVICIILNNNGFAYQTFGETNFHNVLFSFRNESATQETTVCRVYFYICVTAEEVQLYGHCIVVQWLNQ